LLACLPPLSVVLTSGTNDVIKRAVAEQVGPAVAQQLRALHLGSATPSFLSLAAFRKQVLDKEPTWPVATAPWWDLTVVTGSNLNTSKKLKRFCKDPPTREQDEVKVFQPWLMKQLKECVEEKSDGSIQSLSFVDTHAAPLIGSARKPDISMVERGKSLASLFNVVSVISIKKVLNEEAATELAAMLDDLLVSNRSRSSSQAPINLLL